VTFEVCVHPGVEGVHASGKRVDTGSEVAPLGVNGSSELASLGVDGSSELSPLGVDLGGQTEESSNQKRQRRPHEGNRRPRHSYHHN
jgi:hypothetical protein